MNTGPQIADMLTHQNAVTKLKAHGVVLPTFAELADPSRISDATRSAVEGADAGAADPRNLFRCHWFNDRESRGFVETPGFIEIPASLSGSDARIVVMLGERFPMIGAHKVLAAYACLVPRLVTGAFDPDRHRAVWPSTGNYCRGGIAISRILGCRGVAVLPEGMSRERFDWLERWASDPGDIIRTPGTESNVKEIYDKCAELEADADNVIINQFCEFGNYMAHYHCTGGAALRICEAIRDASPNARLAAFVAATGSAGTLAAGDRLKEELGARSVAVEAIECPTMLRNGYGEHNIQGIGDKHIPLIHNVMNTDCVIGISDRSSDGAYELFNTPAGRDYLARRKGIEDATLANLSSLGLSCIANVLAAARYARHFDLGADDVVMTVATDNASLYSSQIDETAETFDEVAAAETYGEHLAAIGGSELLDLTFREKQRIFNLGYYTWVEQQGISVEEFDRRKDQSFWRKLRTDAAAWDALIEDFNEQVAAA